MGAAQSSTNGQSDASGKTEEDKHPRPYDMTADSNHLLLSSSYRTLYSGMLSIARDTRYADLHFVCGKDRYRAHRAIVCPRSTYFEDRCNPPFYDANEKMNIIWIDPADCESDIFAAVLAFLYTLNYNAVGKQAVRFGVPEKEIGSDPATSPSADTTGTSTPKNGECEVYPASQSASLSEVSSDFIPTPSHTGTRYSSDKGDSEETCDKDASNELVFHLRVFSAASLFRIEALRAVAHRKFAARLDDVRATPEMIGCLRHLYDRSASGKLSIAKRLATLYAVDNFNELKKLDEWDDLVNECPGFCAEMFRRL